MVGHDLGAALVCVLARGLDHTQLLLQSGMWFNHFHIWRATVRTSDFVIFCDQLVDVVVHALLAEAFLALAALACVQHH